jgi:hypothetical protein
MKSDFLKECLSDLNQKLGRPVPLDAMNKEYCTVCANPECARAGVANGGFFTRTQNWEKLLFNDVKQIPLSDPAASSIVEKWREKATVSSSPIQFQSVTPVEETPAFTAPSVSTQFVEVQIPASPTDNNVEKPIQKNPVRNPFLAPDQSTPQSPSEIVIESGATFTFGD